MKIQTTDITTGEIVHTIPIQDKNKAHADKALLGVLRRLGDNYGADLVEDDQ